MLRQRWIVWLFIGMTVMIMTACGDDSNAPPSDESTRTTWDQMKWDQGKWE